MDHKTKSKEAETAALRAALERELQNKKQCAYQTYECTQLSLAGYNYCLKHILNDKNAPFRQCNYVYMINGKRCPAAAPQTGKKEYGYCNEHALKTTLVKNRQNAKFPPPTTPEVILTRLSHYIPKPKVRTLSSSSSVTPEEVPGLVPIEEEDLKVTKSVDPFVDIDANHLFNTRCDEVLDFCSESESDVEPSTCSTVWHDEHMDSSDDESIDSDEDILKHANVFTAEEVTLVSRNKLMRLQALYIDQYRQLQHILKEKRRKYVHNLKRESMSCGNIYNQNRSCPKEQRLYKKLKLYNRYQKTNGIDAILTKRVQELRSKVLDAVPSRSSFSKCSFTEDGVKCTEKALPMTKHCRKHILDDPNQVLFVPCGQVKSNVECITPVEAIFEDTFCRLHMEVPLLRSYDQFRKDSESDLDDTEAANLLDNPSSSNVKTELLDYNLPCEIPKMETVPTLLFEEQSRDGFNSCKSELESVTESLEPMDSNQNSDSNVNVDSIDESRSKESDVSEVKQSKEEKKLEQIPVVEEKTIKEEVAELEKEEEKMDVDSKDEEMIVDSKKQEIIVDLKEEEIIVDSKEEEIIVDSKEDVKVNPETVR